MNKDKAKKAPMAKRKADSSLNPEKKYTNAPLEFIGDMFASHATNKSENHRM
jgi:hypothetical protein